MSLLVYVVLAFLSALVETVAVRASRVNLANFFACYAEPIAHTTTPGIGTWRLKLRLVLVDPTCPFPIR